ncbi:MAG: LytTR family transcriptional regulator [Clostridia bacterium]|nr:LytTR family transcriptional regulator [Clostridia bacterium]
MKCEVVLDPTLEDKVVVYVKEEDHLTDEIKRLVEGHQAGLIGYHDKEMIALTPAEILFITVVNNKVYAVLPKERLWLKERLYALEGKLPPYFIKINQSCLANLQQIERFDASLSGTLQVRFKNGDTDYVSRRQLKTVKERIGIYYEQNG